MVKIEEEKCYDLSTFIAIQEKVTIDCTATALQLLIRQVRDGGSSTTGPIRGESKDLGIFLARWYSPFYVKGARVDVKKAIFANYTGLIVRYHVKNI